MQISLVKEILETHWISPEPLFRLIRAFPHPKQWRTPQELCKSGSHNNSRLKKSVFFVVLLRMCTLYLQVVNTVENCVKICHIMSTCAALFVIAAQAALSLLLFLTTCGLEEKFQKLFFEENAKKI